MALPKTPLRYPGGKPKLAPFLKEILAANELLGGDYCEPYAGGAGAAIELLLNRDVSHIHLNDSSIPIYSFWKSVLEQPDTFCRLVASASLTIEEWRRQQFILKKLKDFSEIETGFSVFFLNRVNRSGVITGGLIGGLAQDGEWKMDARFPRNELIRRIEAIAYRKSDISITNEDAETYIKNYLPRTPKKILVYCDPPYFEKSEGLYLNNDVKKDHESLAKSIQTKLKRKCVLSYDATNEILNYYKERNSFLYDLQYSAAKVYKGKEVFIFSDRLKLPTESQIPYINPHLKKFQPRLKSLKNK